MNSQIENLITPLFFLLAFMAFSFAITRILSFKSAFIFILITAQCGCSSRRLMQYCSKETGYMAELSDCTISYTRAGAGKPLIYVHGAYGSAHQPTYTA